MNKLEKHIKYNHYTNLYSLQQVLNLNMGVKKQFTTKINSHTGQSESYFDYIDF